MKYINCCSVAQSCLTLWDPHGLEQARLPCLSPSPGACSESYPLNRWCHPIIFLSVRVFYNEWALCIKWPKYWNFSPSNEYSRLISFRIDWFDLLAFQRILKSLLQHHSSKASILQRSTFFIVQLSHPYMTTGKTIALTMWTFVGKVMSLLFITLSKFVIAFLPRSNRLNFMAAVIVRSEFGAQGNKIYHYFHCFSICLPWSDGTGCRDLSFLNVHSPLSLSSRGSLVPLRFLP